MIFNKKPLLFFIQVIYIIEIIFQSKSEISEMNPTLKDWQFKSYPFKDNFLTKSKEMSISILSLINGTIMGVDASNGHVMWSINDKNTFLETSCSSEGCFFFPSTSGDLYILKHQTAFLITIDENGSFNFNKEFNAFTSHIEVVTIGIHIITGKLYFITGTHSCFENTSDSLSKEDMDNLLIIRRTLKVMQVNDIPNQKQIFRSAFGHHEIFSYNIDKNLKLKFPEIKYNIYSNILFGNGNNQKNDPSNCWSLSLSSPVLKIWKVIKTPDKITIFHVELKDLVTNQEKSIKLVDKKINRISNQIFDESCDNFLILNQFLNQTFLHRLENNRSCKKIPILLKSEEIQNLNKAKYKYFGPNLFSIFKNFLSNNYFYQYVKNLKNLKLVSTKRRYFGNFYQITKYTFSDKNISQIEVIIPVVIFWREILITCFIFAVLILVVYFLLQNYFNKRFRREETQSLPLPQFESIQSTLHSIPETIESSYMNGFTTSVEPITPTLYPRFSTEFKKLENIGVGGYGVVCKALNLMDKCTYAIKCITVINCKVAKYRTSREVQALAKLSHQGIIRYHASWYEQASNSKQNSKNGLNFEQSLVSNFFKNTKFIMSKSESLTTSEDSEIVFEHEDKGEPKSLWENIENSSSDSLKNTQIDQDEDESSTNKVSCDGRQGCNHFDKVILYIQMELCHKETLKSYLFKKPHRDIPTNISIFKQILSALHFCHSQKLMHRDIKPSNIFFSFEGTVKIGDFGLVTKFKFDNSRDQSMVSEQSDEDLAYNNTITKLVGTELYMAPELKENRTYDFKIDIYSLGLVFFEIIVPFFTQFERIVVMGKAREMIFPTECKTLTPDFIELTQILLSHDPNKRPSTAELYSMELTENILSLAEPIEQSNKKIVETLSVISQIHQYSDLSNNVD